MEKKPELSIIMPVFNSERFISFAMNSILAQSFGDFELIIVNDGSTDHSMEIIKGFDDERIRIITNERNSGIVYSRNRGLAAARGRFVAPFDSDDIAREDKFEKQIVFLEKNPEFGMIGSWAYLIDEKGDRLCKKWKLDAPPERIPAMLLFRNYFVQSAVVIRREALPSGFYTPGYDVVEDYKMWIDITHKFKVWNYPDYLIDYRVHSKSITQREAEKMNTRDMKIFSYLYEKLNIVLDDNNLSLLLAIKSGLATENFGKLKDIEKLLLMILARNRKLRVYDHKELTRVVYNRYLKICLIYAKHDLPQLSSSVFSALHRKAIGSMFLQKQRIQ